MKPNRVRIAVAAAVLGMVATAALSAQAPAPPPKRAALLVGINRYERNGFIDLRWAENDVDEVGTELRRLGFDKVVTMTGSAAGDFRATRSNIETQVNKLLVGVGKEDVVLVLLCGHGQELPVKRDDGTTATDGFYCPVDAVLNEPETMISVNRLANDTLYKRGGKNIVLVDACRDGIVDLDRRARGIQGRLVSLRPGTAILFSCSEGQTSIERDSLRHGVFSYGLLEVLRRFDGSGGPLTWGFLADSVMKRVLALNQAQEPFSANAVGLLVLANRASNVLASEGTRAGDFRDDNGLRMKFRWCPPGRFLMGSPPGEDGREDNEPQSVRAIDQGFWIGQFEVTQSQWKAVMGTTPEEQHETPNTINNLPGPLPGLGPDYPMYEISHSDALAFCRNWTD
jgi:hypothetical protein